MGGRHADGDAGDVVRGEEMILKTVKIEQMQTYV